MADSSYTFREVRLVSTDGERPGDGQGPVDVYVYLDAYGDSPIGIQGWHHKQFPADRPAVSILKEDLKDALMWPPKAPPERQMYRLWFRMKDAHPDLPRTEAVVRDRKEAVEGAEQLRKGGHAAGIEVLDPERGWTPVLLLANGGTATITGEMPDAELDRLQRMLSGEFEPEALEAAFREAGAEVVAVEDVPGVYGYKAEPAPGIYAYGTGGYLNTGGDNIVDVSSNLVFSGDGVEDLTASGEHQLSEVGVEAKGGADNPAGAVIELEGVSSAVSGAVKDADQMTEEELAAWRDRMARLMKKAFLAHRGSHRLFAADLIFAAQFLLDNYRPGSTAAIASAMLRLFPGRPLPEFLLAAIPPELQQHPAAGALDLDAVREAREVALETPLQLAEDLTFAAGRLAELGDPTAVAAIGVALERLYAPGYSLPPFMRGEAVPVDPPEASEEPDYPYDLNAPWESQQARAEGWALLDDEAGPRIGRALDDRTFGTDEAALAFVREKAADGSAYHQQALGGVKHLRRSRG